MNEARAPTDDKTRKQVLKAYHNGTGPKELSEKTGISINTIKSWINRDKAKKKNATTGAPKKEEGAPPERKQGAPVGNRNAVGAGAPKGNKNAEKHGFFSRYLPEDALEIMEDIKDKDPSDILWENIQLSYTAILRAQKIMHVKDKSEMIKELKKKKEKADETEMEWEFQFSWDRQSSFLTAQAKAMSELRSLIKQYEDLASEEQMARIDKMKAETERIRDDMDHKGSEIVDDWIDAVIDEEGETGENL